MLDFGISKITDADGPAAGHSRKTTAVMGSPLYMSPEQMRSAKDVDARADIWALGIILFELMTGRPAFQAETMTELVITGHDRPGTPDPRPPARRPGRARGGHPEVPREGPQPAVPERRGAGPRAPARLPRSARGGSVERISGIIQAAGLSQSALDLPPSPRGATTQLSAGTPPPVGRTTAGTSNRTVALVIGGGAGALLVTLVVVGVLTFGRQAAHPDTQRPTATEPAPEPTPTATQPAPVPEPTPTPAPVVNPAPRADTVALDAGLVVPQPVPQPAAATPAPAPPPTAREPAPAQSAPQAAKPTTQKHSASGPCKLIETVDKNGEPHFTCPCATCR